MVSMKKLFNISFLLVLAVLLWGCADSTTNSPSNVDEADPERQFIWEAMNYWYYWQADVPMLADKQKYFKNKQAYHNYLSNFQNPEALFNDLLFNAENFGGNIGKDDFSFFIENYEEFHEAQMGNTTSFGFNFGLVQPDRNSIDLFGYVQYVLPDSPADEAGLKRGDIFTGINGTSLTINNYQSVLSADTYELMLAEREGGSYTPTGETISVQAEEIQEDPVFTSKVIETGSSKVGYLVYNAFQRNSHERLNEVFGDFNSQGVDELIVDLRYNGGGAVITSAMLASMISGLNGSDTFARFTFSQKRSSENGNLPFYDQLLVYDDNGDIQNADVSMNQLSIDRVFVLTSFWTASASEALVNGIEPFMEVVLVGSTTRGKDEGSYTLYDSGADSEYLDKENANPDHKYAIQPIVLKIVNKDGMDYPNGFLPDIEINERDYLETLPPLGDESDPVVARALEEITGEPVAKTAPVSPTFAGQPIEDKRPLKRARKGMYLQPDEMKKLNLLPAVSDE